jgi:hypothetical protein
VWQAQCPGNATTQFYRGVIGSHYAIEGLLPGGLEQALQRVGRRQVDMQAAGDLADQRMFTLGGHQHIDTATPGGLQIGNRAITVRWGY